MKREDVESACYMVWAMEREKSSSDWSPAYVVLKEKKNNDMTIAREAHLLRARDAEGRDVYASILLALLVLVLPLRDAVPVRIGAAGFPRAAIRAYRTLLAMPSPLWHPSQTDAINMISKCQKFRFTSLVCSRNDRICTCIDRKLIWRNSGVRKYNCKPSPPQLTFMVEVKYIFFVFISKK